MFFSKEYEAPMPWMRHVADALDRVAYAKYHWVYSDVARFVVDATGLPKEEWSLPMRTYLARGRRPLAVVFGHRGLDPAYRPRLSAGAAMDVLREKGIEDGVRLFFMTTNGRAYSTDVAITSMPSSFEVSEVSVIRYIADPSKINCAQTKTTRPGYLASIISGASR